jgi:hypothetical protein
MSKLLVVPQDIESFFSIYKFLNFIMTIYLQRISNIDL